MPFYVWKGVNSYGEKRKGKVEMPNEAMALSYLKKMRITPSVVKEAPKDVLENIDFFKPKVTGKDVVIFTRQLSTMIDAGLPLVQSLEILGEQTENPSFKKVLREVRMDVETGTTFADAMKKHPNIFDSLYCNMVEAGEVGIPISSTASTATWSRRARSAASSTPFSTVLPPSWKRTWLSRKRSRAP